jgi:Cu(I)/Ag(I) efflux system membrane fusion protein
MKRSLIAAALAAFLFTSCSDGKQETSANETENHGHHEGMAHGNTLPVEGTVVVEAPDYAAAAGPVKEQIAAVVGSYLKLKDNLVASDAQKAQAEAKAVVAAAEKVDVAGLESEQKSFAEEKLSEVKQAASTMAASTDLAAQRAELELLSEASFALAKAFGASSQELYYQHCPMANNNQGAYWLSSDKEIRNPYFGEQMLACGSIEEVHN